VYKQFLHYVPRLVNVVTLSAAPPTNPPCTIHAQTHAHTHAHTCTPQSDSSSSSYFSRHLA
jgi:hypothetical protein